MNYRTSKTTKNIIDSEYLSVWHNRPLWPKAFLSPDLVDSFEGDSRTSSDISGHGTRGLTTYKMRPADFRRHGDVAGYKYRNWNELTLT
jgi:hypothetical protein